jgi:hypothetical protein
MATVHVQLDQNRHPVADGVDQLVPVSLGDAAAGAQQWAD